MLPGHSGSHAPGILPHRFVCVKSGAGKRVFLGCSEQNSALPAHCTGVYSHAKPRGKAMRVPPACFLSFLQKMLSVV